MNEQEKNILIKNYLLNIFMLCKNNVKDKKMYQIELESLKNYIDLEIEEEPSMQKMFKSLEKYADNAEKIVKTISEDPKTKSSFWLEYMKWAMWQTLRDAGIGHLSKFYLQRSVIVCEVHINMRLDKNFNESKNDFEKRKSIFEKKLQEADLEINNHKILGRSLKYTEKNRKYIEDFLKQYCDITSIKYNLWEDTIRSIEFYISKDSKFSFMKKKEPEENQELSDATIEDIADSIKNWMSAISVNEEYENEKLKNTSIRLAATMYNSIAYCVDYENEELKKYRAKRDSKRERNKIINQKKEEIGSTYNNKILQELNNDLTKALSDYLVKNYCLYLSEMRSSEIVEIELLWNVNEYGMIEYGKPEFDLNNIRKTFEFPSFMSTDNSFLLFTDKNIKALHAISKELCGRIKDIKISYNNETPTINKITIIVDNLYVLLEKFL